MIRFAFIGWITWPVSLVMLFFIPMGLLGLSVCFIVAMASFFLIAADELKANSKRSRNEQNLESIAFIERIKFFKDLGK